MTAAISTAVLMPGVTLPGGVEGPRPDRLLNAGSLLLAGAEPGQRRPWDEHRRGYGPIPRLGLDELAIAAEAADLRGFGGAGFPTAVKLRGAAGGRPAVVVVNGSEGEAASAKDGVLLRHVPHLVLDGALLAARALGSSQVVVRVSVDRPDVPGAVTAAAQERGLAGAVQVSVGPSTFAAGESSAVLSGVFGGEPLPTPLGRPPLTPARLGRRRRPALVSNVETFARLALAARGLPSASALLTMSGALRQPGVVELASTATLDDAIRAAGGPTEALSGLVTGGWHGRWLPWSPQLSDAVLTREGMERVGGRWGAGIMVAVPAGLCAVSLVAAVARTLAAGSAGQCGPCRVGLPFVAGELAAVATSSTQMGPALVEATEALASLRGRGMCAHPTASVDALRSALQWAEGDIRAHRAGGCGAA
jgi:NADH:ubiquinone oxidoreductase subunit F (NADH-binding)